jgi:hypothetical protein
MSDSTLGSKHLTGSLQMTAAMTISGTIGWFVLVSGQPVIDVVFWRCAIGAATLAAICAALGLFRRDAITRREFLLAIGGAWRSSAIGCCSSPRTRARRSRSRPRCTTRSRSCSSAWARWCSANA